MVKVASFSEAGGHPVNEDAFLVQCHPSDPDCWLCFLADGQGGRAGGAQAAQLACRVAAEVSLRQPPPKLALPSIWTSILRQADQAVAAAPEAGYTTLIGFGIIGDVLVGASSGDSAVLVRTGNEPPRVVTSGQVKNPPVGSGAAQFMPFGAKLTKPWLVLAMSDGVWKYAGWQRIMEMAANQREEALLDVLQGAARLKASGQFPDDFTVVMFGEPSDGEALPGHA